MIKESFCIEGDNLHEGFELTDDNEIIVVRYNPDTICYYSVEDGRLLRQFPYPVTTSVVIGNSNNVDINNIDDNNSGEGNPDGLRILKFGGFHVGLDGGLYFANGVSYTNGKAESYTTSVYDASMNYSYDLPFNTQLYFDHNVKDNSNVTSINNNNNSICYAVYNSIIVKYDLVNNVITGVIQLQTQSKDINNSINSIYFDKQRKEFILLYSGKRLLDQLKLGSIININTVYRYDKLSFLLTSPDYMEVFDLNGQLLRKTKLKDTYYSFGVHDGKMIIVSDDKFIIRSTLPPYNKLQIIPYSFDYYHFTTCINSHGTCVLLHRKDDRFIVVDLQQ